jgi:hypothetical protein
VARLSVTLKRPIGVGVVTAPIAAENEARGREPCISQMRRACRLARIQVLGGRCAGHAG